MTSRLVKLSEQAESDTTREPEGRSSQIQIPVLRFLTVSTVTFRFPIDRSISLSSFVFASWGGGFASMMADGDGSRYVKLSKAQNAPMEDIRPGELNQPIEVPQLEVHRCSECGQPLPESYSPPSNEPWTTGIFGCSEDPDSCWTGLFCPCVLFGRNVENMRDDIPWNQPCLCHAVCVEGGIALAALTAIFHGIDPKTSFLIGEGLMFGWWMCGIYTGLFRQSLQKKYHLKDSPCDPCMVHCCLHWCALCQEHREMKGRLSENMIMPMTVVNAPSVQDMNRDGGGESVPNTRVEENHANLEIRPV